MDPMEVPHWADLMVFQKGDLVTDAAIDLDLAIDADAATDPNQLTLSVGGT